MVAHISKSLIRQKLRRRLGILAASSGLAQTPRRYWHFDGPSRKITYAVATADLNVGYPYATLPKALGYYQQEGLDVQRLFPATILRVRRAIASFRASRMWGPQPDAIVIQRIENKIPLVSFYAVG